MTGEESQWRLVVLLREGELPPGHAIYSRFSALAAQSSCQTKT